MFVAALRSHHSSRQLAFVKLRDACVRHEAQKGECRWTGPLRQNGLMAPLRHNGYNDDDDDDEVDEDEDEDE